MKKLKDLIKTPEYWLEEIQNELFRQLHDYMKKTGKSQSDIAKELKVSESYVSQILNGNFNFTLKKLIDISLYIGKVPDFNFSRPESFLSKEYENTKEKKEKYLSKQLENVYLPVVNDNSLSNIKLKKSKVKSEV